MKHTPKAFKCAQKKQGLIMVGLRLPKEEYEQLVRLANDDQRSYASMARILMQRGLQSLRSEAQQAA